MKRLMAAILLTNSILGFGESLVDAEMEILAKIEIGRNRGQVYFKSYVDGEWNYPSGPFVDNFGRIIFYQSLPQANLLVFERNQWTSIPYTGSLDEYHMAQPFRVDSQQGVSIRAAAFVVRNYEIISSADLRGPSSSALSEYRNYPAPFGIVSYSINDKRGVAFVFDFENPSAGTSFVDSNRLPTWLRSQAGGFYVGDDGLLYRNGILWSSPEPKSSNGERYTWTFLGRLLSGHPVWGLGSERRMRTFVVTDTLGRPELRLRTEVDGLSTFGLGPWGELYFLLPPPLLSTSLTASDHGGGTVGVPAFDYSKPAELATIRSHLKFFGRLNDESVRLRKGPAITSEVLGTYPMKTGFRILEKGAKEETIGTQKNVWYKVKLLNGEVGWFFGAYVKSLFDGPNGQPPPWPNVPDW